MKRILFVSAGYDFPDGAFNFLQSMNEYEPVFATGLFFCPADMEAIASASHIPIAGPYLRVKERDRKIVDAHKELFTQKCEAHHIKHHIHENWDEWQRDILARDSRFSDMAIVSGERFYSDISDHQPNAFLREALHAAECPVMVVPENYSPIQHLVVAYDGGKESLHALKQFCYLLPQYTDLPGECIYAKDDGSQEIPDLENLKCYSRLHFSCMNFSKLHFKAAQYFATWIGEKQNMLMISGSFGRAPFSYLTKRSFSENVVRDHKMPVFIAHT